MQHYLIAVEGLSFGLGLWPGQSTVEQKGNKTVVTLEDADFLDQWTITKKQVKQVFTDKRRCYNNVETRVFRNLIEHGIRDDL